jgi:alpha/beta superfamily hydrolase
MRDHRAPPFCAEYRPSRLRFACAVPAAIGAQGRISLIFGVVPVLKARNFSKRSEMPEVIFTGPAGRLEGRYQPSPNKNAPIAIVLHPHPQFGGTMNNRIVYELFYLFQKRNFTTLRFNFRGIGRSQGEFDHGTGELSDAASALDWVQSLHPDSKSCWVAGYSFGAWIGMQLLMRRPEIEGFISVAPQPNSYDFSFLAPCPSSGLIVHGDADKVAPPKDVQGLVDKLHHQKGIVITQKTIKGANHFFTEQMDEMLENCGDYVDRRLNGELADARPKRIR